MKRFILSLAFLLSLNCVVLAGSRGLAVEDAPVADGLVIADHLVAGSNNNIDGTTSLTNAFTVTAGSPTITVSYTSHGLSVGNAVTFYSSTVVGGLSADGAWTVATVPNANSFTFTHTANANSTTGPTGSTIVSKVATDLDGKLRFKCLFSHLSYNDPILFPGIPNATHLHLFFGNTLADYNSTYTSLRAAGDGTCQGGPLNRTGYWMPAMIDASLNKVRIPVDFQWYYAFDRENLVERTSSVCSNPNPALRVLQDGRLIACPQYAIKKLERGMRAIMGFKVSAGGYPSTYVGPRADILAGAWACFSTDYLTQYGGFYRYLNYRANPSLGLSSNGACPTDGVIQLRVSSPTCWNGSHAGTDGYDQIAPTGNDGAGNALCPASHPYAFMGFTVITYWYYTGGISQLENWYLSSDRFNGADFDNGESFHWDMWWAWNDTVQEHFHKYVHGMFPNPAASTHAGGPYIYSWIGSAEASEAWVGGPFIRNTNTGGLSGNAGIGDCTTLGIVGKCSLNTESGPLSNQLVDIPPDPG